MKRSIALILAGFMTLSFAACGKTETTQIATPFVEYATMEEAGNASGFILIAPEEMEGYPNQTILGYTTEDKMIQLEYSNDKDSICVRKALVGKDGETDISGVYNTYAENETVVAENELKYDLKGENQKVYVVNWRNGECNFSIYADAGMDKDAALALAAQIL